MSNYTTKTASLKTVNLDSRITNTKELFVNGEILEERLGQKYVIKTTYAALRSGLSNNNFVSSIGTNGVLYICLGNITNTNKLHYNNFNVSIRINNHDVLCSSVLHSNGGRDYILWNANDDLTKIYGGITNSTPFIIFINIIPKEEPVILS